MKKILITVALVVLVSCNSDKQVAELKLDSMQCLMCSIKIEEAVQGLKGVKEIEVDLKNKTGKVIYKANLVDLSAIEKIISSIGYSVNDKKPNIDAYNNLELCCKKPKDS